MDKTENDGSKSTGTTGGRRELPPNKGLFLANLEHLGPEMGEMLLKTEPRPTKVERDVQVKGVSNPQYLIIIGFSSTYVLEAIKKKKKAISNILIIEPSLNVFRATMEREWIGALASDPTIDLLVGIDPKQMGPHIYQIFTYGDAVSGSRAMRCMQPEIVVDPFLYADEKGEWLPIAKEIMDVITATTKQVFLSMGCASDSFIRFEQTIRNEKTLTEAYSVAPLFKKFENVPVVVLGAGPSLESFINEFPETKLKNDALIIASDAALIRLLKHGIKPHIVTRCERKLTTIFKGIGIDDTKGIFFAAYPWVSREFFDLFDEKIMLFRDNGVCKWTEYNPGAINGGVSAANAAFEMAYELGAKEIYLSGVDLAVIDGKTHVAGTEVEFDPNKSKEQGKWKQVLANDGTMTTTIPVWERCLSEYRTTMKKHENQARVITMSPKGAKIEGTELRSWKEL